MYAVIGQDKWTNLQDANNHSKAYMIKGTSPVTLTAQSQSIMFGSKNFMLIPQNRQYGIMNSHKQQMHI